jgi:hypothetical protein
MTSSTGSSTEGTRYLPPSRVPPLSGWTRAPGRGGVRQPVTGRPGCGEGGVDLGQVSDCTEAVRGGRFCRGHALAPLIRVEPATRGARDWL